jgi:tryptophanyl-tRNA synthetase
MAAVLLACGLEPLGAGGGGGGAARCVLFRQSAVREHAELAWLLGCATPLGWLQRMTQFKAKAAAGQAAAKGKGGGGAGGAAPLHGAEARVAAAASVGSGLGLLAYPVLQAADIALYRATDVPVGEDQAQHLELARAVLAAFNGAYGPRSAGASGAAAAEAAASFEAAAAAAGAGGVATAGARGALFPLPATLLVGSGTRVMSLRDGKKKMSKSDPDAASRIELIDDDDTIASKLRAAKTDSAPGFLPLDAAIRPEKTNLVGIFAALSDTPPAAIAER